MIADRIIDDKITLKDLLAQAVCLGVKAGRGEIDYTRGPWHIAGNILEETQEILDHRSRITDIAVLCDELIEAISECKLE